MVNDPAAPGYECRRANLDWVSSRLIPRARTIRIQGVQRTTTIRHRTSLFEEAKEIVESEYGTDLSLDEIARRVASSRRQLQRSYSEIGDTTFRSHLTAVRMHRAADMLAGGRLTVREVAQRVGYRQPAQFAKAFRRIMGASPSDWREHRAGSAGLAA
jgi:transcriptional regulator GlxA family with amidase domain